ncbi:hypothetical protein LWI28_027325 [Acer negundo]|uniref:DUF4218 domain-containing protein n=1 Tax=Acer negundo TaxID=4023 RepID=A0AAD5I893_ACENE|nr:hypothetical protein LWI28_027325 [Acer negundo]
MKTLKGYVHNRNQPEGCIAECYIAEEAIEFCTEYFSNISTIGNPYEKNNNIQVGKPLSEGQNVVVDHGELLQAHLYVLYNTTEVQPYIEIVTMDDDMPSTNKKKRKDCIERNGKIVVESILDGIPYGPGANALLKDLGKLARKIIPLTVNDWRKVPK